MKPIPLRRHFGRGVEDLFDASWNHAHALVIVVIGSFHGVRLARTGLAVGKHADAVKIGTGVVCLWDRHTRNCKEFISPELTSKPVSVEGGLDELREFVEDQRLRSVLFEDQIELKRDRWRVGIRVIHHDLEVGKIQNLTVTKISWGRKKREKEKEKKQRKKEIKKKKKEKKRKKQTKKNKYTKKQTKKKRKKERKKAKKKERKKERKKESATNLGLIGFIKADMSWADFSRFQFVLQERPHATENPDVTLQLLSSEVRNSREDFR